MKKCIVCDKEANKEKPPPHYDVVIQVRDKHLYLHNVCFFDLSLGIQQIHAGFVKNIKPIGA